GVQTCALPISGQRRCAPVALPGTRYCRGYSRSWTGSILIRRAPHRVPLRPGSAGKGPLWCICSRNFLPRRPLYRSWQVYVSHQRRRSRYRAGEPQGARRFLYVKAVRNPAERKLVVTPGNFAPQVMLRPDPERALAGSNRETIRPLLAASVLREVEEDLDIVGLFALQDILNPDPAPHRIVCKVAAMLHRVGQSHVTVMRCANGLVITFQVNVLNGRMCVFRPWKIAADLRLVRLIDSNRVMRAGAPKVVSPQLVRMIRIGPGIYQQWGSGNR